MDGPTVTAASLRDTIVAKGDEIRKLRATGSQVDAEAASAALRELLAAKDEYQALTGEEYRKSTKRNRGGAGTGAGDAGGSDAMYAGAVDFCNLQRRATSA